MVRTLLNIKTITSQHSKEGDMNILNDTEHRIFLSAMRREKEICERFDSFNDSGIKLLPICRSIERKVNEAVIKRVGKWIKVQLPLPLSDGSKVAYRCPFCNTTWEHTFKHCPNCGERVKEE